MPSSRPGLSGVYPGIPSPGCKDDLWDPGQEWIQIFDNLLKHPQGVKRGCSCDICSLARSPIMPSCPLSPRLSLPTNLYKTQRRSSGGRQEEEQMSPGEDTKYCIYLSFLFINYYQVYLLSIKFTKSILYDSLLVCMTV